MVIEAVIISEEGTSEIEITSLSEIETEEFNTRHLTSEDTGETLRGQAQIEEKMSEDTRGHEYNMFTLNGRREESNEPMMILFN